MIRKGIIGPDELRQVYTHWPQLDEAKITRLVQRNTRRVRIRNPYGGDHSVGDVLNVNPILLVPFQEGTMVLNGKHRGVTAIERDCGLVYFLAETIGDLQHGVPSRMYEGLELANSMYSDRCPDTGLGAIQEMFSNRGMYHSCFCVPAGIVRLEDHLPQLQQIRAQLLNR